MRCERDWGGKASGNDNERKPIDHGVLAEEIESSKLLIFKPGTANADQNSHRIIGTGGAGRLFSALINVAGRKNVERRAPKGDRQCRNYAGYSDIKAMLIKFPSKFNRCRIVNLLFATSASWTAVFCVAVRAADLAHLVPQPRKKLEFNKL